VSRRPWRASSATLRLKSVVALPWRSVKVGRQAVSYATATVALRAALANGQTVRVVAVIQPGQPVVFTLSGAITDFVSPAAFRLRGVGIDASAAVYLAPATAGTLASGVKIRIKGTVLGRRIVASQVELQP
jgi:hypothetical protein